jgi:hypothetical protein
LYFNLEFKMLSVLISYIDAPYSNEILGVHYKIKYVKDDYDIKFSFNILIFKVVIIIATFFVHLSKCKMTIINYS